VRPATNSQSRLPKSVMFERLKNMICLLRQHSENCEDAAGSTLGPCEEKFHLTFGAVKGKMSQALSEARRLSAGWHFQ
jgi:hypothetical protein